MVHRPSSQTPNQSFEPCSYEWNHRPCLFPSRKADCCYYCFAVSVFYATSNGAASDWFFTGSFADFSSAIDNVSTKPRRIFHPSFSALDWSTVPLPTRPRSVDQTLSAVFVRIYYACFALRLSSVFTTIFFLLVLTSNIILIFNFIKTVCSSEILPYQKSPDPSMNN